MTDELDTKPLPEQAPKDAPPDTPQEGESMPIEIPPGDDGLRSHVIKLTMRQTLIESKVEAIDARLAGFMTPKQIEAMYQRIADETVKRVETLKNDITSQFSEIQFSASQVEKVDSTLQTLVRADGERKQSHEFIQRALSSLLGYDISQPSAPRIGLSIFETMKQTDETAEKAVEEAESARKVAEQVRYEGVQFLALAKQIAEYHTKNEAALAAVTENAMRWKGVQDALQKVISNPRILIPALTALGGGGTAVALLIERLF